MIPSPRNADDDVRNPFRADALDVEKGRNHKTLIANRAKTRPKSSPR